MAPADTPLKVIQSLLPDAEDRNILDIGCGRGDFAAGLIEAGYRVTGVDPQPEAITRARQKVLRANFLVGTAEALPIEPGNFDAAVFLNALHHVTPGAMGRALLGAKRSLRAGGFVIVIEPLAEGSFFELLRIVDDESAVRTAAQAAIREASATGLLTIHSSHNYLRRETFRDASQFIERIIAADPARAVAARQFSDWLSEIFGRMAEAEGDGFTLVQPIKVDVLQP